jgi:hypothetical protein
VAGLLFEQRQEHKPQLARLKHPPAPAAEAAPTFAGSSAEGAPKGASAEAAASAEVNADLEAWVLTAVSMVSAAVAAKMRVMSHAY